MSVDALPVLRVGDDPRQHLLACECSIPVLNLVSSCADLSNMTVTRGPLVLDLAHCLSGVYQCTADKDVLAAAERLASRRSNPSDPCEGLAQAACDAKDECTWCKSAAVPSSCYTRVSSRTTASSGLPHVVLMRRRRISVKESVAVSQRLCNLTSQADQQQNCLLPTPTYICNAVSL